MTRIAGIEEVQLDKDMFEMRIEALHFIDRDHRMPDHLAALLATFLVPEVRNQNLVTDDLYGSGQVEGTVIRAGRYLYQEMAAVYFRITQAILFATEQNGHIPLQTFSIQLAGTFSRIDNRTGDTAGTRTGTNNQPATGQGGIDIRFQPCLDQHIVSPRSTGGRLGIGEAFGFNQHQLRQAHGLHGACRRANIPGVAGIAENDANAG